MHTVVFFRAELDIDNAVDYDADLSHIVGMVGLVFDRLTGELTKCIYERG